MSYLIGRGAKSDATNKKGQNIVGLKCRGEMTQLVDNYTKMLANNEQERAVLLAASRKVWISLWAVSGADCPAFLKIMKIYSGLCRM